MPCQFYTIQQKSSSSSCNSNDVIEGFAIFLLSAAVFGTYSICHIIQPPWLSEWAWRVWRGIWQYLRQLLCIWIARKWRIIIPARWAQPSHHVGIGHSFGIRFGLKFCWIQIHYNSSVELPQRSSESWMNVDNSWLHVCLYHLIDLSGEAPSNFVRYCCAQPWQISKP